MNLTAWQIGLSCLAAFVAGVIDAIAGGGGLITVPTLIAVGLPPHLALGTNKGQSIFGSGSALWRFQRAGLISADHAKKTFPLGFVGSLIGAQLVLLISPSTLRPLVLVLLGAAAVAMLLPKPTQPALSVRHQGLAIAVAAFVIGAYDGFFGPGTGTFLILTFVLVAGHTLANATADAKVVNFASNVAAVILFSLRGAVLWKVALPMAAAQLLGGTMGAHLAIRGGDKLIRRVVIGVVLALGTKIAADLMQAHSPS